MVIYRDLIGLKQLEMEMGMVGLKNRPKIYGTSNRMDPGMA